jgi:hypothetical protein
MNFASGATMVAPPARNELFACGSKEEYFFFV